MVKQWRITVLVAIYRAGRFLAAKLKTLADQTIFSECQIVLLNCQNLDSERAIYQDFVVDNHNVITIEYDNHRRLYSTWNDGIAATQSDYIINSNCDDMLHPACFEYLADALDNNPECAVAHGNSYVTDIPCQHWPNWCWHGLIETMYPGGTAGPCPMWRRSLHDRFGPFNDYRTIGDARMWERWTANGVRFWHVPEALTLYYHAPGHNLETRCDEATGRALRDLDIDNDIKLLTLDDSSNNIVKDDNTTTTTNRNTVSD